MIYVFSFNDADEVCCKVTLEKTPDITIKKNVGPASLHLCASSTASLLLQGEVLVAAEQGCVYHRAMLIKCSFNYH